MAFALASWLPQPNFICLHYVWVGFCSLLAFPILYPYGNLTAIDTLFFGCSSSTESGLNTVDVKDLKTYQQVYIYVIPIITNLMFINTIVVAVRLHWFGKRLRIAAETLGRARLQHHDFEHQVMPKVDPEYEPGKIDLLGYHETTPSSASKIQCESGPARPTTITFGKATKTADRALSLSAESQVISQWDSTVGPQQEAISQVVRSSTERSRYRSLPYGGPERRAARSIERAATSAFVLGNPGPSRSRSGSRRRSRQHELSASDLPQLSRQATIGRNSNFYNLTEEDREKLGGIEYRALRLLLKFVICYLIGIHLIGVICLLPWILNAPSKYTSWLNESGVGRTWWAFYSAQTMVNNLGFTLTPDSMATFKDATWPMLVMTFLAFAGNTCYPVFLRCIIWISSRLASPSSSTRESLQFLLDHPRRCYTLLFPSRPTWILFGIVFLLNFIDVVLIITLDLHNPAVADLPMGPRILSALFQAASARHTGTSTLNLALVNPAVQFSLLTMMYIAIFPIAISIRASNTDEERTLGIWSSEGALNERNGWSYIMVHVRNQLTFDLWYIFLGTFLISIVEAERIMDLNDPSFSLFPVLFEVTSAYGNVGLSLGGPFGYVSMSGHYKPLSKLVICAMMIRGRHRGLPYALDRAINLPVDAFVNLPDVEDRVEKRV